LTGEHHWKFLLHVVNTIDTKVTKCLWTDCNSKGIKNNDNKRKFKKRKKIKIKCYVFIAKTTLVENNCHVFTYDSWEETETIHDS
jgi:hypothetical protein